MGYYIYFFPFSVQYFVRHRDRNNIIIIISSCPRARVSHSAPFEYDVLRQKPSGQVITIIIIIKVTKQNVLPVRERRALGYCSNKNESFRVLFYRRDSRGTRYDSFPLLNQEKKKKK